VEILLRLLKIPPHGGHSALKKVTGIDWKSYH
jgi:hypothetical protein